MLSIHINSRENMYQYAKKRAQRNSSDNRIERSLDDIKKSMKDEMLKPNPSISILQKDLDSCRRNRREEAKKAASAADHLKEYPALKCPALLKFQFEAELGLTKDEMRDNWITALPSLMTFFLPNVTNVDSLSLDQMTVKILEKLPEHFKTKEGKDKSTPRLMVQTFDVETTISDTKPKAGEPPRLVEIGSNDMPNLTFSLYVDSEAIFCGTAIEALIQMYALYCIFNIEYSTDAKLVAFTFVAAVIFRKKVSQYYS